MKAGTITLDCAPHANAGLATVDRLARIRMAARRRGLALELQNVGAELRELIELCGLAATLGVEVERQPEQRKEPRRVEKEGDVGDPSA